MTLPKQLTTITSLSKIIASVLFITLPFLGFYLGMEYQTSLFPKANQDINNVATTPTKIPVLTDQTANWETYTNKSLTYSFKYPQDWRLGESKSQNYPYINLLDSIAQNSTPGQTELFKGAMVEVYINDRDPYYTNKPLESVLPLTGPAGSAEQYNKKEVSNLEGTSYTQLAKNYDGKNIYTEGFGFVKVVNGKEVIFDIKLSILDDDSLSITQRNSYINLFNQILSTFEFLNQTQTTGTESWKTYIDNNFNYQIKYPQNWDISNTLDSNDVPIVKFSPIKEITGPSPWNEKLTLFIGGCGTESPTCGVGWNSMGETERIETFNIEGQEYNVKLSKIMYTENKTFAKYAFQFALNKQLKKTVHITAYYFKQEQLDLIKQILSTFKFLDQNQIECKTDQDCPINYSCQCTNIKPACKMCLGGKCIYTCVKDEN